MTTMDPQWALLAGALVFIITPGIALFYGGRERATSMVNMMMLSAGAIAVTTLVWTLWGWSLAFAGKDMAGGVIGDPLSGLLFRDSMVADHGVFTSMDANSGLSGGIPAAFRLACAVVAVALITGGSSRSSALRYLAYFRSCVDYFSIRSISTYGVRWWIAFA